MSSLATSFISLAGSDSLKSSGSELSSFSSTSISKNGVPELTVSPIDTFTAKTFPATDVGISIAALSDSRTIIGSSELTLSPTFTQISITSTSSASPRSGILRT